MAPDARSRRGTPERVFFAPDARADPLLIGCALAVYRRRSTLPTPTGIGSLAGLGAVGAAAGVCRGQGLEYAAGVTIVELATAWMIVGALSSGSPLARLLSFGPLATLGTISYGLYVWQGIGLTWIGHDTYGLASSLLLAVVFLPLD
jgi:peptidoglycan/LPS O-acetylase OafA/YrhL